MTSVYAIDEESAVGEARRGAAHMAARLGFSDVQSGQLALIVTEAGRNLVRHAGGGQLLLRAHEDSSAIHILTLDRGPGIPDVARALRDGFSTGGTSGNGLGAIKRLASQFDIYSQAGNGTAMFVCCAPGDDGDCSARPGTPTDLQVGVVQVAMPGEEVCGDSWGIKRRAGRDSFMICDGLGHGPQAALASREGERIFHERDGSPGDLLEDAHAALRHTRGAAMALATRESSGAATFAGVGNIAATLCDPPNRRGLMSHNGIVGGQMRRAGEIAFDWPTEATLVMHSDGLGTSWSLDKYPGLAARHPALIAGVLFRDFARERDDATVMVARPMPA